MTDLLAARAQMAMSLGFHIIFAEIGVAMPVLMVIAEWQWRRTGDGAFLTLARQWAKGTAVLFAVGAVSGTVLSFELGLLFPGFMKLAGPLVGMPFSLEGFAFFLEAILIAIYLFGWRRLKPWTHFWLAAPLPPAAMMGAFGIIAANSWMNTPGGFTLDPAGKPVDVTVQQAIFTPMFGPEYWHFIVAMFLTKDLHIHWRKGEQYFMQKLVDGDIAANNGGWQWCAGTGADAAPYFRIQNPWNQTKSYDPAGQYIKRWVEELREVEPKRFTQPPVERLAEDYPNPVVDHAAERLKTLERFNRARQAAKIS